MVAAWGPLLGSPEPFPGVSRSWSAILSSPWLIWELRGPARDPRAFRVGRLAVAQRACNGGSVLMQALNWKVSRTMLLREITRIGIEALTVIVILALVALFIGLRLYSVLGERTGHEQQPILKPADPEAVVEPQVNQPSVVQPSSSRCRRHGLSADRRAGRARLAGCRPDASTSRVSSKAPSPPTGWSSKPIGRAISAGLRPFVDDHVFETFIPRIEQREKDGLVLDNRLVDDRAGADHRGARPSAMSPS